MKYTIDRAAKSAGSQYRVAVLFNQHSSSLLLPAREKITENSNLQWFKFLEANQPLLQMQKHAGKKGLKFPELLIIIFVGSRRRYLRRFYQ